MQVSGFQHGKLAIEHLPSYSSMCQGTLGR